MTKKIVTEKNPAECDACGYEWESDLKIEVEVDDATHKIKAKLLGFERRCPICGSEDIVIKILDETGEN
jgi:predicted Zn-ribbon and HTH transcriptional regulator